MAKKKQQQKTLRPWHRREDETPPQYNGFVVYCSLPATLRTAKRAYQLIYQPAQEIDAAPKYFQKWMSQHEWVDRAAAFDTEIRENFLDDEAERSKLELYAYRQRQLEMSRRMQKVAAGVIDRWLELLEEGGVDVDGTTLNAAMRAIELSSNAEARALGVGHVLKLLEANEPDGFDQ